MLNKKLLISLSILGAVALPFSAFAVTSDSQTAKNIRGFFKFDASKMTEKQKANVTEYAQKQASLQKEFINKMVTDGAITKEQGDAQIARIDEKVKSGNVEGLLPGFGGKKGGPEGKGGRYGKMGPDGKMGFGMEKIDTSKLNDTQKADLLATYKKIATQKKDSINKMIANGLFTKEQGDQALKRIDEEIASLDKNGLNNRKFMGMNGGFGGFDLGSSRMKVTDATKLTEQQKSDFKDSEKKMAELHKELVNKMVTYGSMTKEQGDAAIKRIDEMSSKTPEQMLSPGFRGKSGPRGGHNR